MSNEGDIIVDDTNAYGIRLVCFDDYIYKHSVAVQRMWDEEVVHTILSHVVDGTDVLDIGANIGLVTLGLLQRAVMSGRHIRKVHCFECDTRTFQLLITNLTLYPATQLYPFALSDTQQLCQSLVNEYNQGCNRIYSTIDAEVGEARHEYSFLPSDSTHVDKISFLSIPLDSILYQFPVRVSVVKLDVEGFELNVLRGATVFLERHRPVIIIEVWAIHWEKARDFLAGLRYSRWERLVNPHYNNEDYVFYPDA